MKPHRTDTEEKFREMLAEINNSGKRDLYKDFDPSRVPPPEYYLKKLGEPRKAHKTYRYLIVVAASLLLVVFGISMYVRFTPAPPSTANHAPNKPEISFDDVQTIDHDFEAYMDSIERMAPGIKFPEPLEGFELKEIKIRRYAEIQGDTAYQAWEATFEYEKDGVILHMFREGLTGLSLPVEEMGNITELRSKNSE